MLAGAGTGKTAALTARLANLLRQRLAWPSQILCVTFTNKAAREMRERVGALIGPSVEGMPWLGTFHAIAAKMLRRHAELVGLTSSFSILDTDDQMRLLKQLIQAEGIDDKRWPAKQLAGLIDRWKNRGLTPADLDAGENEAYANGRGAKMYGLYQDRLRTINACDFGDLLLHMLTIFRQHRDVLESWQDRFRYIMVDEYQDTNAVQYLWLRLLAQVHKNICVVGDDDQSIYSWRGAEVANILRFEKDFPGAAVIRLEQNYRSTPHILGAASGLIEENAQRLGKHLWTERDGGDKVRVIGVWDGPEEARRVGEEIERLEREGCPLDRVAILVRAQFQTREFEDRFIQIGLAYRIVGGFRFYERAEIRDALAYLRLVSQPSDDLAFERIYNTPKRGLGDKTLEKLHRFARAHQVPLLRAAYDIADTDELPARARNTILALVRDFLRWRDQIATLTPSELARTILDESGYTGALQAEKSAEANARLENLSELVRAMEEYETLGDFLEHVSLVMDNEAASSEEKVTIMTIHAAKGLEFDQVFLPGWEEGVFPRSARSTKGASPASKKSAASPMWRSPARAAAARSCMPPIAASMASGRARSPRASSRNCRRTMSRAKPRSRAGPRCGGPAGRKRATRSPMSPATTRPRRRAGAPAGNALPSRPMTPSRAAWPKTPAAQPASPASPAPTSPSARACSTTSSAMAWFRPRKATSWKSPSKRRARSACSTAS
jgi:DNA helicase-2/ATP-dependent DNA helicase PcrA